VLDAEYQFYIVAKLLEEKHNKKG
jgi:hypothetical protein